MQHPFTQDFLDWQDAQAGAALQQVLARMSARSWYEPYWVLGTQQHFDDGKVLMSFSAQPQEDGALPLLAVYPTQALAAAQPTPFFEASMAVLSLALQENAMDLLLMQDVESGYTLTHGEFLRLRLLIQAMNNRQSAYDAKSLSDYQKRIDPFVKRAVAYCTAQSEVQRLHLGVFAVGAAPPYIGGLVSGTDAQRHVDALRALHDELMQPGDQAMIGEHSALAQDQLVKPLLSWPPMFDRRRDTSWQRFFRSPPGLPIFDVELTGKEN